MFEEIMVPGVLLDKLLLHSLLLDSLSQDSGTILPSRLHRSLQYLTFSQSLSHFFRHVNGRLHALHSFVGKVDFECLAISTGTNQKM
jgi:hypothetical protein